MKPAQFHFTAEEAARMLPQLIQRVFAGELITIEADGHKVQMQSLQTASKNQRKRGGYEGLLTENVDWEEDADILYMGNDPLEPTIETRKETSRFNSKDESQS